VAIELSNDQKEAIEKLKSGSILDGGVGAGKSRTAIAFYQNNYPKNNLYIITTAKKRDKLEWDHELIPFLLSTNHEFCFSGVSVVIDSWNNIKKYEDVEDSFFILDEQRLVGSGAWVKSFYKIAKKNEWILLTATPGDTWLDYIPVFVANGFYKHRTEFIQRHVIYKSFSKYPQVDRYIDIKRLVKLKGLITVKMKYLNTTILNDIVIPTDYDVSLYKKVSVERWNPWKDKPIKNASELCYALRKVVNSDESRLDVIKELTTKHPKLIIFYNFNYELKLLINFGSDIGIETKQWNGHKHEEIPTTKSWIYLVQYGSGAEGWECIETDAMILYSQNYSYKATTQAAGRIDRRNTPFKELYYYYLRSSAWIDIAIAKAYAEKKKFNENNFFNGF